MPWRHPPRKRDHDGGWSAADRLDLFDPRACGARSWVHSYQPDRVCPRRHRQSAAAACGQCGRAIRIRAAVWQAGSSTEASDGDPAADRDRPLLPAYGRPDKRAMAADDAARLSRVIRITGMALVLGFSHSLKSKSHTECVTENLRRSNLRRGTACTSPLTR